MNDLIFYGGLNGVVFGNQQFTVRNLTFYNSVTAISQIWDWGWTYKSISINNCSVGLDMTNLNTAKTAQAVGSITFIDSSITNTAIGFNISHATTNNKPATGGSLILENVALNKVPTAIRFGPDRSTILAGTTSTTTIQGYVAGHAYTPTGPTETRDVFTPYTRPASLLSGGKYYERSKPQYNNLPVTSFSSVRAGGAVGNGVADDTAALQKVINDAATAGKVVFFDAGTYKVTKTLFVPKGSKLVGEAYSVILSSGAFFNNVAAPQVVVQVGNAGDAGIVEWSDMIVSTQGTQAGAILIKWNLASTSTSPSGMWDVHTRIGGFAGSNLQFANCPATPTSTTVNKSCMAAYLGVHISKSASGLYMENTWIWVADHDIEDPTLRQITIYAARGLYVESTAGNIWLVGTAVEHFQRYQYQFAGTQNIFMGQIQTETPYYQPNPNARTPYPTNATLNDPNFDVSCPSGSPAGCSDAWGVRILTSSNIAVYGAGLYSFFNNYSTSCNSPEAGANCQSNIFGYDSASKNIRLYNLNTVGSTGMIHRDTTKMASGNRNVNVFVSTVALYRSS